MHRFCKEVFLATRPVPFQMPPIIWDGTFSTKHHRIIDIEKFFGSILGQIVRNIGLFACFSSLCHRHSKSSSDPERAQISSFPNYLKEGQNFIILTIIYRHKYLLTFSPIFMTSIAFSPLFVNVSSIEIILGEKIEMVRVNLYETDRPPPVIRFKSSILACATVDPIN